MKTCFDCKQSLPITSFHTNGVISKRNPTQRYKPRCITCNQNYETLIYFQKLRDALSPRRMQCEFCGYCKSFAALEFHHTNPKTKDRTLSTMRNYSYVKIKAEVDKCVLLCGNCHAEEHERLRL